ncbi:vitellogenin [Asbolus verrucosus]|uniref:Vitellogenin n=1 Tax=Asbolus verrucosus TaxID=1661398 RepID=A0A482WDD5_ASBVE|nr:vitellogenin [Asbolus verrucosus]
MWSQLLLCVLVGFAYASNNPAWKENYEYVYQIRARSLASLDQITDDYSGIVLKAKLTVRPRPDGDLDAKISEAQYAQIHAELYDSWDEEIPDSKLSYKKLPISSQPFQMVMHEGAIRNLVVDKEITNWEANVIKSFVAQLQLDTGAKNSIPSHYNILSQEGSNTAVFKTMEETVTGISETLYEIHPFPEYVLQTYPWLVPLDNLVGDGEIIEVVKSINYTHSVEYPSYNFGAQGIDDYEPSNKMADFSSRSSETRAVITGDLKHYIIQSSVTVDQIVLSPTMGDKQKGSVNTMVNLTLLSLVQQPHRWEPPSDPVSVGLVYRYNKPFDASNEPIPAEDYPHDSAPDSVEAKNSEENSQRYKRAIGGSPNALRKSFKYNFPDDLGPQPYYQEEPTLNDPPQSPLLPFTVGYDGQSITKKENIAEVTRKLAQKIGQEVQQPEQIPTKNTVGKFLILTSLLRVMNQQQMQEVAEQLNNREPHGPRAAAWKTYRDAVAQAGTGPALITIKEWIKTNKIANNTAAAVVATAANSARQPTDKYVKAYFEMVQDEDIMSQPYLNESVLLSSTNLIYQVCVNKRDQQGKYPVPSFGPFCTKNSKDYVEQVVIPYLTQKLHQAVAEDDTQNIHAYIRALGNVGHQQILEAFEQYLEGQKQASHFQRVLMVVSLDKLTRSNPRVARSVLYKIYQNPSENEQVRVAAVYLLMCTNPPPSMLQRMASYTNVDSNQYVNAAVKSSIESASRLKGNRHAKLRFAAESAKPLLTSEEYGAQYSYQNLRSYVVEQIQLAYKQYPQFFGGADYILPKGIKYSLQKYIGGVQQNLADIQAMVSSVDDLINVYQQQTEEYQEQLKQKHQNDPSQNQFSSESVAQLLNMNNEQREQLEGNVYFQIGSLQKIWSFDNQTFENLPQVVQQLEEEWKHAKHYDYSKMVVGQETAIAFPTALGLPFIYTYDRPTFVRFETDVKANANPPVSTGSALRQPDTVEADFEIRAYVSGRVQSQFGIFTPFDSQRYSAGYDKNFQMIVPLAGKVRLEVKNNLVQYELRNANDNQNVNVLHYSTWPYTAKNDIYDPEPERKIIRKQHPHVINQVLGKESTGIAVNLQLISDKRIDFASIYENFRRYDFVSAILSPAVNEDIQYVVLNVVADAQQSTTENLIVRLNYIERYQPASNRGRNKNYESEENERSDEFSDDQMKRDKEFERICGSDIHSVHIRVADATAEFKGQKHIKYTSTAAVCKSNVDPRSRVLLYFKKDDKQAHPLRFYLHAHAHSPNTNGLNLDYAMEMNTTSIAHVQAFLSGYGPKQSKITAQVEFSKSEERKQYLKEQPKYQECQRQMQEGNYQLPICAEMTARANLLDQFSIKVVGHDVDPRIVNQTYKVYSALRYQLYPRFEENIVESHHDFNELNIEGQFHPNLEAVNFSVVNYYGNVEAKNVKLNSWARSLLVPHPVFHLRSRLANEAYKYDTYRPICVIDKTAASTFDNKSYPVNLGNDWTVLLHYVPRRPSNEPQPLPSSPVPHQLKQELESHIVEVRASQQEPSQKELKVVIQTPETQGKLVEINLKPKGSSHLPKLFIDKEEIKYNDQQASNMYDGYIQAYALPNHELKLEISDSYYIIYDGARAKVTVVNSKFRDASRGLCGTFTGEPETDFTSPDWCILKNPQDFVDSYTISHKNHQLHQQECYQKEVVPANYISAQDSGKSKNVQYSSNNRNYCTKLQTQYVVQGHETCFTLRPLPMCKQGCRQNGSISRNVPVHCVRSTEATQLWKNEINKVGFAYASHNPAWQENKEYVYQVRARTLTSLNQISNDYTGILLKAQLRVRPRSDGHLDAEILEPSYAQIQAELKNGWKTYIPESELNYKELPFSSEPFQIKMKNGAVSNIVVNKDMSNWQANVIKSFVSQFQLDTRGENIMRSHMNVLTQENSENAVYKTMEPTVTGVSETFIERPSYHFGVDGIDDYDLNNKIGEFYSRNSVSGAVITGTLNRFTVQSVVTVDQIVLSPTMADNQKGSLNTRINVTLLSKIITGKINRNYTKHLNHLCFRSHQELEDSRNLQQKNTVGKFVILSSLLRVMNQKEMQEVDSQLDADQNDDVRASAWKVYRDAVAQAGTGPALMLIRDWIKSNKTDDEEATELVYVAANAARQPTEEYMDAFYNLIQSDDVMSQSPLNESALLAYTTLVHQVYVNRANSHNKYPVYSFGPFNSEKGRTFVMDKLIPYLSQKLEEAIANADTQDIHTYIRALGNVGHQRILEVFEPYLEGQKKASHFQRLLMVVALDNLAESNPRVARSVLYKIYQNPNEDEQVRVAAVSRLICTKPSASMLQHIASHTNVDPNHYVNAAVKSAIESAAQREEPEYAQLRAAAQSAIPLLTNQEYGAQYSQKKLRSYIVEQLQQSYKQSVQIFGGEDLIIFKGLKYNLRGQFGGVKQQVVNAQAMVSSFDDLINVLQQQTKEYQTQKNQKQANPSSQYKLSSEWVAKLLNMENKQREQLEGNLYLQMGSLQRIWSFDNHTIENLTQDLKNGKSLNYNKLSIQNEAAVSVPTALGLPFIYTYDRPMLIQLEADIKATANPSNLKFVLRLLEELKASLDFSPLSIINVTVQVMIGTSKLLYRFQEKLELMSKIIKFKLNCKILIKEKITIPYTAQNDIYNPKPDRKIISKKHPQQINQLLGQKSTGIAFYVKTRSDQPIDGAFLHDKLRQHDLISAMLSPWLNENIQHTEINVGINSAKSSTKKLTVQASYKHVYDEQRRNNGGDAAAADISRFDEIPNSPLERQKEFVKRASVDINNSDTHMVDVSVEFSGTKRINYVATASASKSNIDPNGRFLLQYKKQSEQEEPSNFYLSAVSHFPNTNGLNLDYAMQMDPTSTVRIQGSLGENYEQSIKFDAQVKLSKSEERKQYLREQPEYEECQRQMQEGNHQLPVCAKMTARANLLDQITVNVDYDKNICIVNQTYKLYSILRQRLYPRLEEDITSHNRLYNRSLNVEVHFHPNLQAVNFSVDSEFGRAQARNVELDDWVRTLLVPHPVFHAPSRVMGHVFKYDTYRPICVVDQNAASTFDNRTYPVNLSNNWTVLLHYVPRRPSPVKNHPHLSVPQQLYEQIEDHIVHVRAAPEQQSQKEVKILIQTPQTKGKVMDITLKPAGSSKYPRLFINNEEIRYNPEKGHQIYEGYIQVYGLPNNEVKAEINDAFYVIYDGTRVKLIAVNSKFRDASRGLCGTFTGAPETDFLSPANCIIEEPEEFVSGYTIEERPEMRPRRSDEQGECRQKNVRYVNVISSQDAGRARKDERKWRNKSSCTMHQTQYVVQGDEICFTIRPRLSTKSKHFEEDPCTLCRIEKRHQLVEKADRSRCQPRFQQETSIQKDCNGSACKVFTMKNL